MQSVKPGGIPWQGLPIVSDADLDLPIHESTYLCLALFGLLQARGNFSFARLPDCSRKVNIPLIFPSLNVVQSGEKCNW